MMVAIIRRQARLAREEKQEQARLAQEEKLKTPDRTPSDTPKASPTASPELDLGNVLGMDEDDEEECARKPP